VHLYLYVFVCRIENPLVCVEGKDEKDEDDEATVLEERHIHSM